MLFTRNQWDALTKIFLTYSYQVLFISMQKRLDVNRGLDVVNFVFQAKNCISVCSIFSWCNKAFCHAVYFL